MKKICVIDGQGGGIGATIIKKIKENYSENVEIIALGTNAIATSQMLKARANKGASGENAIVQTVQQVDIIIGTISIIYAHAMMGEMTPKMTEAISQSPAKKIIIPITQENIQVVGMPLIPLPRLVEMLVNEYLSEMCQPNK
ncbi:hypothetical protein MHK_010212 [Candidatus Magnetomorum sp. HK-1]|nr:hypothetical protein MHK_010212 [Candidatus Magnetomorum sp. HK-1]